jgi:hypothetical protein
MPRPSKEHILSEIRRLAAENDGVPLGLKRFATVSGIQAHEWKGFYWARWNDAIHEAGFDSRSFWAVQQDDDALLQLLAQITRELGHVPGEPDLLLYKRIHPEAPHASVFRERFGKKQTLVERLFNFVQADPDYADVAAIITASARRKGAPKQAEPDRIVTGVVYLLRMGEYYKIGKSNDPGRRVYELGLQLPEKHDLVHTIETDDPSGIESYWHKRFGRKQTNGEWFALSPEDVTAFSRRTYM